MNNASNSDNFKTAIFADCLANSKEIFQLIDRVFPLDSCRHYQVLPLRLADSNLILGMLDPKNQESLKFANSIAKVYGYNLEIQLIDLPTHQIILANYPQDSSQSPTKNLGDKTIIETNINLDVSPKNSNRRRFADSAATIISASSMTPGIEPEVELELPPDLDLFKDLELTPRNTQKSVKPTVDSAATLFEIPPEFRNQQQSRQLDDKPTIIGGNPAELLAQSAPPQDPLIAFGEIQLSSLTREAKAKPSILKEQANPDFLPQLMPQLSWQKLLEQAFVHHTDYIILRRYSDRGSIIASCNKLTQSAIEQIPLSIYCSLIDEIERMARLPQTTASHSRKVVLEKIYEQERILLRLEFGFKENIEQVGIQILRHEALEIYEQLQMDQVCDRALQLAKQLEKTLRRIQSFDCAKLTNFQELQNVHSRINHQLRLLDK